MGIIKRKLFYIQRNEDDTGPFSSQSQKLLFYKVPEIALISSEVKKQFKPLNCSVMEKDTLCLFSGGCVSTDKNHFNTRKTKWK